MSIIARHKKSTLTLHIGVTMTKNKYPDPTKKSITLPDLLRELVEDEGDSLETYYAQPAFERRDLLKTLVPKILNKPLTVLSSSHMSLTPDEKSLLSALKPYADIILEGTM